MNAHPQVERGTDLLKLQEEQGILLGPYVPNNAYILVASRETALRVADAPGVKWVGRRAENHKISGGLDGVLSDRDEKRSRVKDDAEAQERKWEGAKRSQAESGSESRSSGEHQKPDTEINQREGGSGGQTVGAYKRQGPQKSSSDIQHKAGHSAEAKSENADQKVAQMQRSSGVSSSKRNESRASDHDAQARAGDDFDGRQQTANQDKQVRGVAPSRSVHPHAPSADARRRVGDSTDSKKHDLSKGIDGSQRRRLQAGVFINSTKVPRIYTKASARQGLGPEPYSSDAEAEDYSRHSRSNSSSAHAKSHRKRAKVHKRAKSQEDSKKSEELRRQTMLGLRTSLFVLVLPPDQRVACNFSGAGCTSARSKELADLWSGELKRMGVSGFVQSVAEKKLLVQATSVEAVGDLVVFLREKVEVVWVESKVCARMRVRVCESVHPSCDLPGRMPYF